MDNIQFSEKAWEDIQYWLAKDKKNLAKIFKLIENIKRSPYDGLGKPEPLKGYLSGFWSRRIDDVNRIVYSIENNAIAIVQCRSHYGDK